MSAERLISDDRRVLFLATTISSWKPLDAEKVNSSLSWDILYIIYFCSLLRRFMKRINAMIQYDVSHLKG